MDPHTHARFQPLHQWLSSRQQTLMARVSGDAQAGGAAKPLEGQALRDMRELADIRSALRRMELGTYGDCNDCGEPISMMRLVSRRESPCCSDCESRKERGFEMDSQFTLF